MTEALRVCVGHRAATHTEVGTDGLRRVDFAGLTL